MKKTVLCLLFIISGCNNSDESIPPSDEAKTPQPNSNMITLNPQFVPDCEVPTEVLVKWDLSDMGTEVKSVEIYVKDENDSASEKLFVIGPIIGEAKTGAWVNGYTHFMLKANGDQNVIKEIKAGGAECH